MTSSHKLVIVKLLKLSPSGEVEILEEGGFLENLGELNAEKEKDLATCFGFDVRPKC